MSAVTNRALLTAKYNNISTPRNSHFDSTKINNSRQWLAHINSLKDTVGHKNNYRGTYMRISDNDIAMYANKYWPADLSSVLLTLALFFLSNRFRVPCCLLSDFSVCHVVGVAGWQHRLTMTNTVCQSWVGELQHKKVSSSSSH